MRFGSLFTGIGGFDLGFERAGMTCAWQCEIDRRCRELLARRWPDVVCYDDVRELHVESRTIELIAGGFPCQDLSTSGRRAGLAGERSGLWYEFHRVLSEARPPWVVIENVPGLLSSNGGRDFAIVLQGLAELGYRTCWRVLDSQYFGVPQRRRRVFVVGYLGDGRAAEVLLEPSCVPRDNKKGKTLETFLLQGVYPHIYREDGNREQRLIASPLMAADDFISDSFNYIIQKPRNAQQIEQEASSSIRIRGLTPTECERLQGFPDGWTAGFPDTIRYRMLGNAVTVPVAEWIGRRILMLQNNTRLGGDRK